MRDASWTGDGLPQGTGEGHRRALSHGARLCRRSRTVAHALPTGQTPPAATVAGPPPDSAKADSSSRRRRDAVLRQVTVAVFNFEANDADPDVELRQEITETFRQFVTPRIERFGGTTLASSGQEVLACFGFPVAYEDSPQRAVRAAL